MLVQPHKRHIECSLVAEFLTTSTRDQSRLTQTHEPAELHQRLIPIQVIEHVEAVHILYLFYPRNQKLALPTMSSRL